MSSYGSSPSPDSPPENSPPASPKKATPKKSSGKMSDKQKADLKKHMEKHKKAGMSASEMKSHRMKMMVRMRKGMSVAKAHNDIKKPKSSK
jgi:predicted RNase H-like nuclease|tara:strand:- start:3399 stop:3671 length:273 start_codon:yes stop_codon:yes gene_type:complete